MEKNDYSNRWLWFIARRTIAYSILGAAVGTMGGGACLGLAFSLLGFVLQATDVSFFVTSENAAGENVSDSAAIGGAILGLLYGAMVSAVVGLIGFAIFGIIAAPSRKLWPDKKLRHSMLNLMTLTTALGVLFYFVWSAIIGQFRSDFVGALQEGVVFAFFGIPALMCLGQIAGIWRGILRMKKTDTSQISI